MPTHSANIGKTFVVLSTQQTRPGPARWLDQAVMFFATTLNEIFSPSLGENIVDVRMQVTNLRQVVSETKLSVISSDENLVKLRYSDSGTTVIVGFHKNTYRKWLDASDITDRIRQYVETNYGKKESDGEIPDNNGGETFSPPHAVAANEGVLKQLLGGLKIEESKTPGANAYGWLMTLPNVYNGLDKKPDGFVPLSAIGRSESSLEALERCGQLCQVHNGWYWRPTRVLQGVVLCEKGETPLMINQSDVSLLTAMAERSVECMTTVENLDGIVPDLEKALQRLSGLGALVRHNNEIMLESAILSLNMKEGWPFILVDLCKAGATDEIDYPEETSGDIEDLLKWASEQVGSYAKVATTLDELSVQEGLLRERLDTQREHLRVVSENHNQACDALVTHSSIATLETFCSLMEGLN